MIEEYRLAFFSFVAGMLALHGSLICFAWLADGLTQVRRDRGLHGISASCLTYGGGHSFR